MTQPLLKNEDIQFELGDSARQRIHCGLRWDPAEEDAVPVDLDLLCLTYDEYGDFAGGVSGVEGDRLASSGNIHHGGDDIGGEDEYDDERVSFELFNLSRRIHNLFLVTEIQSDHIFDQVAKPEIRIANSISDENMVQTPMNHEEGQSQTAFIFGRIYRCKGGWAFHYIGEYLDRDSVEEWSATLKDYLPALSEEKKQEKEDLAIPGKGETVPLFVTQQAKRRVICGLQWDSLNDKKYAFDLDLACILFDADKECVDGVSGKPDETIDQSGAVYHTGDDTTGAGEGDDEQVSIELLNLPEEVQTVVFLVEIQSNHGFADIRNPIVRIADGMTDRSQLHVSLEGGDNTACVFASISRRNDGWLLHYIGDYIKGGDIEDWVEKLQEYL